jgi:NADH:ubiquinone oxidoreductase subunit E
MTTYRSDLLLCGGTGCHASGSLEVKEVLKSEVARHKLEHEIRIIETGCNGFCAQGPIMIVLRTFSIRSLRRKISPTSWRSIF